MGNKVLVSLNLNQNVYLKMDESDLKYWQEDTVKYLPAHMHKDYSLDYYRSKVDKETGLVKMQLHEYVEVFKERIRLGSILPCEGDILFDLSDFTTPKRKAK